MTTSAAPGNAAETAPPRPRVAAVIPAFDAARTIEAVVEAVRHEWQRGAAFEGDVFVVDDGSSDDTAARARASGAIVVPHPANRGKGAALRTGLQAALDSGHGAAVTIDADGQHPAIEAARLASMPPSDDALVLGVRDLERAGAPRPTKSRTRFRTGS
ncbi:MAG: glycosyltransferase family 2 protein [Polyangiaceae bacterium]